jgi:hypothetical protein
VILGSADCSYLRSEYSAGYLNRWRFRLVRKRGQGGQGVGVNEGCRYPLAQRVIVLCSAAPSGERSRSRLDRLSGAERSSRPVIGHHADEPFKGAHRDRGLETIPGRIRQASVGCGAGRRAPATQRPPWHRSSWRRALPPNLKRTPLSRTRVNSLG